MAISNDDSLSSIGFGFCGSTSFPINAFMNYNLGHKTLLATLSLKDFFDHSDVANSEALSRDAISGEAEVAQRKLDAGHAKSLARYMLKGLISFCISHGDLFGLTDDEETVWNMVADELILAPYEALQPIVTNIRTCGTDGEGLKHLNKDRENDPYVSVGLEQAHVLWVVDGQHRRVGMKMLFEYLETMRSKKSYKKSYLFVPSWAELSTKNNVSPEELKLWEACYVAARQYVSVAVEIHLGLTPLQERQLFHDLNKLGKKIDANLALSYDSTNPIVRLVKELHKHTGVKSTIETVDWNNDTGEMMESDLTAICSQLLINDSSPTKATGEIKNRDEVFRFWEAILQIPHFGEPGARKKTVAAQPVVIKALAKLAYDFKMSKRHKPEDEVLYERLLEGVSQKGQRNINFSHNNPMWNYYNLTPEERVANGLEGLDEYLPDPSKGNRDLGSLQEGVFRFSIKHNDIFPIIGDLIRWQLGLPARARKTTKK